MNKVDYRKSVSPNIFDIKFPNPPIDESPLTIINIFLNERKSSLSYHTPTNKLPSLKSNNLFLFKKHQHKSDYNLFQYNSRSRNYKNFGIQDYVNYSYNYKQKVPKVKSFESIIYPKDLSVYQSKYASLSKKSENLNRDKSRYSRFHKINDFIKINSKYVNSIRKNKHYNLRDESPRDSDKILLNESCID